MAHRQLLASLFAVLVMAGPVSAQEGSLETPQGDPTLEDKSPTIDLPADEAASTAAAPEVEGARCVKQLPAEGKEGALAEREAVDDCVDMVDAPAMKVGPDGTLVPIDAADLSRPELDQRLKERRLELDSRENELALRGALLDAAEQRLKESADELDKLLAAIQQANDDADSAAKAQLQQLATIYQGMKPADAAAIFNQMPASVLIPLLQAMPAKRLAPILAKMQPELAGNLTVQLAAAASATAAD